MSQNMQALIDILTDLSNDLSFHDAIHQGDTDPQFQKFSEYFQRLQVFYADADRHQQSVLARFIYQQTPETLDILHDNLLCLISCAMYNDYAENTPEKLCEIKLNKLFDHIELEVIRFTSIQEMDTITKDHREQANVLQKNLDSMEKTVQETQEKSKHLSEQLISILGIFAGIIVTFSFATTVAAETIPLLNKSDVIYWGFILCVLGFVFLNVLAFLLAFVSKLSGHSLKGSFPWVVYGIPTILFIAAAVLLYVRM